MKKVGNGMDSEARRLACQLYFELGILLLFLKELPLREKRLSELGSTDEDIWWIGFFGETVHERASRIKAMLEKCRHEAILPEVWGEYRRLRRKR